WPYELKREGLPAELVELVLGNGVAQTRAFAELGGQLLFGTDVGYMIDYDPTEEFVYLQRARLAPAQILAMLTTAPAARFGRADRTGRLAPGFSADVVALDGDPALHVRAFAKVPLTMRDGPTLHSRTH